MMSFDRTVTSAYFPGVSDPRFSSSNPAYAPLTVQDLSASILDMR